MGIEERIARLEDRVGMEEFETESDDVDAHMWLLELQAKAKDLEERVRLILEDPLEIVRDKMKDELVERLDALELKMEKLFSQESPCTTWGRRVEERLNALGDVQREEIQGAREEVQAAGGPLEDRLSSLEEEVEAGLSSLGEQVDRLMAHATGSLMEPLEQGHREAAEPLGSHLDQEELLSSIDRHLARAEQHLEAADHQGRDPTMANMHTGIARAHADTARAQAAMLEAVR